MKFTYQPAKRLTQPQLAIRIGVSVTTVTHAETGRLWQAREFWKQADRALARRQHCWTCTPSTGPRQAARQGKSPPSRRNLRPLPCL